MSERKYLVFGYLYTVNHGSFVYNKFFVTEDPLSERLVKYWEEEIAEEATKKGHDVTQALISNIIPMYTSA